jgi:putative chitinase
VADKPLITAAQLYRFAIRCDVVALAPALDGACREFSITDPREISYFLGHCYVETAGFTTFEENLSYSPERLMAVWPRRFSTLDVAKPFALNPTALAEKVYGERLGNVHPGDGWRFRGSGCLDTTGRDNFAAASRAIGVDLVAKPELLRTDRKIAARAAAAFWRDHQLGGVVAADPGEVACVTIADAININEVDDVRASTRIITGGDMGLAERQRQVLRASMIWRPA